MESECLCDEVEEYSGLIRREQKRYSGGEDIYGSRTGQFATRGKDELGIVHLHREYNTSHCTYDSARTPDIVFKVDNNCYTHMTRVGG